MDTFLPMVLFSLVTLARGSFVEGRKHVAVTVPFPLPLPLLEPPWNCRPPWLGLGTSGGRERAVARMR